MVGMTEGELAPLLEEMIKWQRLQGITILKEIAKKNNLFSDESEIKVYLNSDGERSSRDLEKISGVNYKKVQSMWKQWIELGIAEPTEKYGGGRCKKIFELKDFGIK